jgi:hypothetical protein
LLCRYAAAQPERACGSTGSGEMKLNIRLWALWS